MTTLPSAPGGCTYAEWANYAAALEGATRAPILALMRATLDGTIHTVLSHDPAAPIDLSDFTVTAGPMVWVIAADDTGPDAWAALPEMQRWGAWAAVHDVQPTLIAYEAAIEAALRLDRTIFVRTLMVHGPAWERALAAIVIPNAINKPK